MALAPDEWEFLETRLRFWPFYLRERFSAALGHMGTRRPQAKTARPELEFLFLST